MNLLCLTEIEEEILNHSYLVLKGKPNPVYCVLTKTHLILFRKPSDVMSFKCILIANQVKLECDNNKNQFSLNIGEFNFTFTSENDLLIKNWVTQITNLIKNYIPKPLIDFNYTEVKIEEIQNVNGKCFIMIENGSHHLFIYENLTQHKRDISVHIINFKFYTIKKTDPNDRRRTSKVKNSIKIIGNSKTFMVIFENIELMIEWDKIFNNAMNNVYVENENPTLVEMYKNESNKHCADCFHPNPEWVSINLCVTVCLKCSGYHRSLNVSCSRIQSVIMDKRVWEDSYLTEIIKQIGNEKANSFWYKNKSSEKPLCDELFIKDKYQNKKFIDKEFCNLSMDEFTNRLKSSVAEDDVFLTMRLWHSNSSRYEFDFIEKLRKNLIEIAKISNLPLQEKFISVQLNSGNQKVHIIYEKILEISYNDSEKLDDLFIVCLTNNYILIKIEKSKLHPIEYADVCYIYLENINLVKCTKDDDSLFISINPECNFAKFLNKISIYNCQMITINRLTLFDQSDLNEFKLHLLKALIANDLFVEIDDSKLFLNLDVKYQNGSTKCKCLITDTEISFDCPISLKYDLRKYTNLIKLEDNRTIQIEFNKDRFQLITNSSENQTLIYDHLKLDSSKKILIGPIDKMISFIISHGLYDEGIFRISGTNRKVDALLNLIEKSENDFFIDSNIYCVNDVASCLKKYLRSFHEPLITNTLFELFKQASKCHNFIRKLTDLECAVSCLPDINYKVLRKFIELLYIIQMKSETNKMDSSRLAAVTALSLISFDNENAMDSISIMKELIDNIFEVFHYTPQEKNNLIIFLLTPEPSIQNIIRDFYVHPYLENVLIKKNSDIKHLDFIEEDKKFFFINSNINEMTMRNLFEKIFNKQVVELWHFLTKRKTNHNKTIKRLIYLDENCESSVINPKIIPGYNSYFIFFKKFTSSLICHEKSFRCESKFKGERYQDSQLLMQDPNSLEISIFENTVVQKTLKLFLSNLQLYRFHSKNTNKVFLFDDNSLYRLKFNSSGDLKKFVYFFDKFRNR